LLTAAWCLPETRASSTGICCSNSSKQIKTMLWDVGVGQFMKERHEIKVGDCRDRQWGISGDNTHCSKHCNTPSDLLYI
jgi:hypothetical protein